MFCVISNFSTALFRKSNKLLSGLPPRRPPQFVEVTPTEAEACKIVAASHSSYQAVTVSNKNAPEVKSSTNEMLITQKEFTGYYKHSTLQTAC